MLLLEPLLRKYWNKHQFLGGDQHKTTTSAHAVTVSKIDAAIQSQRFWAAARIVREVGFQSEIIGRWSEGCACHHQHQTLYNWSKGMNCKLDIKIPPPPHCDRKGCRSAELASGEALKLCTDSLWVCRNNILEFIHGLDGATQHELRSDWETARSKIVTELTLKLAQWKYLPNLLCGLANSDAYVVQQSAKRAIHLWEEGSRDGVLSASCAHSQSQRFLNPKWRGLTNEEAPLRPIALWYATLK